MIGPLMYAVATFAGGEAVPPPPPPPVVAPVRATPEVPVHDGAPQAAAGQTAADATVLPDDGFGFPVETGPAEIARLGRPRDLRGLEELCAVKPWLCDDSYSD